jgi:hypothetical protein
MGTAFPLWGYRTLAGAPGWSANYPKFGVPRSYELARLSASTHVGTEMVIRYRHRSEHLVWRVVAG